MKEEKTNDNGLIRWKNKFVSASIVILISLLFNSCFKNIPDKMIVYKNDFETRDTAHIRVSNNFGIVDSIKIVDFNGSKVLGRFNSHLVTLQLGTLPTHNALKIEFDLFIHDKWDGDYLIPGGIGIPDAWIMRIDNYTAYITTFSNGSYNQSFPNNYEGRISKNSARSNSWDVLPGVCGNSGQPNGTTYYKIEYTTSHTGSLKLELSDVLQPFNSPCLKSWSIDNLQITAIEYKQ